MRIHLDTDFGGDPDDACALAFLLGSPQAEIVGITTNLDVGGRRAGCVLQYLKLAGRLDIPVAAGAGATLSRLDGYPSTAQDPRYWPELPPPAPSEPGEAINLLSKSLDRGATIVAIGALTNLALLEVARPGSLKRTAVVFMGGWLKPAESGLPPWGPEMDWNVQCDVQAATIVAAAANLTLVTLPATLTAHLRASQLPRLQACGPIGQLLALQSTFHAQDHGIADLAREHSGLPGDLLNFHYDPAACAIALGWPGATLACMPLQPVLRGGTLRFFPSEAGRPTQVVTSLDGDAFAEFWLETIERLKDGPPVPSGRSTSR